MTAVLTRDVPFKKVGIKVWKQLCSILNADDGWKDVAEHIKKRRSDEIRFTWDDIKNFERLPNPAAAMLDAWTTDVPTIGQVIDVLKESHLIRHADLIIEKVLHESPILNHERDHITSPDSPQKTEPPQKTFTFVPGTPHSFEISTLREWTDNFNDAPLAKGGRFIGEGGFGKVYLALLEQKENCTTQLAVKKLSPFSDSTSTEKQYKTEVDVLSKSYHENILQIVGCSYSPSGACIVYEYMTNGSLEDCLACKDNRNPLSASQRMSVALGTARGACHLHTKLNMVHRDLKSANLLLDTNFVVKIGDCGLAHTISGNKSYTMTNVIIGTMIYMPPEYMSSSEISFKLDAYSYGVVLLELITGLPVLDESREENKDLPSHVDDLCEEEFQSYLIDAKAGSWDFPIITALYELSQNLRKRKKLRPAIQDILCDVEKLAIVKLDLSVSTGSVV